MTTPNNLAEIVAGLSKAQRAMVLDLSKRFATVTLEALIRKKLVSLRPCHPDGRGLVLTPLGLAAIGGE